MPLARWGIVCCGFVAVAGSAAGGDFRMLLEKREFSDSASHKLRYRLLKPENYDAGKKYPLVVFLHGAGERGEDNDAQLVHGVKEFTTPENRKKYPSFLIAPQCPRGKSWAAIGRTDKSLERQDQPADSLRLTLDLVQALQKEFSIDAKRIYITGLSMGGYGTWDALSRKPDLFAAAVPICGGGDPKVAGRFKHVPIWVFHGKQDRAVRASRSQEMIEALKKAGGSPRYTEYPDVGHNSWDRAYKDPEMIAWLFSHQQK
jgi:predicted peptidase